MGLGTMLGLASEPGLVASGGTTAGEPITPGADTAVIGIMGGAGWGR